MSEDSLCGQCEAKWCRCVVPVRRAGAAAATALVLALSACVPRTEPHEAMHPSVAPRPSRSRYVCLRDLTRQLDATYEMDERTGIHRLRNGERQVVVAPGATYALVGSELVELDREVMVRYGWAYIPRSLVPRIERLFGRRVEVGPQEETSPRQARPPKPRKALARVSIDPGHGGKDPGAYRSSWGVREKDLVLATAKLLAAELSERGFRAAMTRESDVFVELEDRPALASQQDADLFLSLHANSMPDSSFRGIEVYYWGGQWSGSGSSRTRQESVELAGCIRRAFERAGLSVRKIQGAEYKVLRFARMPAVLVEMGFLSNPTERRLLDTRAYQARLAEAMADGIEAYWRKP